MAVIHNRGGKLQEQIILQLLTRDGGMTLGELRWACNAVSSAHVRTALERLTLIPALFETGGENREGKVVEPRYSLDKVALAAWVFKMMVLESLEIE